MTTVYPISSAQPSSTSATGASSTATTATSSNQLNENTFLTLLVAQLKYQDPMNPADSTQFLTQTAQFTEVETLQKMEAEQATAQAASQVLSASSMIGRPVTYSLTTTGGSGTPTPTQTVSIRGSLPKDATTGTTVTAKSDVYTTQGQKVALDLDFTKTDTGWEVQASTNGAKLGSAVPLSFDSSGAHTSNDVTIPSSALDGIVGTAGNWPATGITLGFGASDDPTRLQLLSGPATIAVAEQDGNDGQTATGIVTGVHLTADGPQLVIGGKDIPYTAVTDVQS
jgi:flagellar basal-body rod modification protein FlgD